MTSHDQAFFTADGDDLVPSPIARGPWGSTISGTYVGGLLGRAIELSGGDDDLQPARLTVDLLRPVSLLEPVRLATTVEREGRRIRLVDAAMTQNGTVVARASALFLRRGEQPETRRGRRRSTCRRRPPLLPMCRATSPWNSGPTARTRS